MIQDHHGPLVLYASTVYQFIMWPLQCGGHSWQSHMSGSMLIATMWPHWLLNILVLKFQQFLDVYADEWQCRCWSEFAFWVYIVCSDLFFFTFTTLWANSADDKLIIFVLFFPENRLWHTMQISLFSRKNKEKISKCHLLKFLPRVLSVEVKKYMYLFIEDVSRFEQ